MKTLIIISENPASLKNLETANHDALERQNKSGNQGELYEAHLIALDFTPLDLQDLEPDPKCKYALDKAVFSLEGCNAFDRIYPSVMVYHSNLTRVITDLARQKSVDSIYLFSPALSQGSPTRPGLLARWFRPARPEPPTSLTPPVAYTRICTGDLLRDSGCKLVVTGQDGMVMRLSYQVPAAKAAARAV